MNTDMLEVSCECCDQPSTQECPCDPCECDPCECKECEDSSYTSDSNAEKSSLVDDTDEDDEYEDDEYEDDDDDFEEFDDDHSCIIKGRWIYDGSNSIDEMIEVLQREIALLEDMKQDGWVLKEKVMNDCAYFEKIVVKPEVET